MTSKDWIVWLDYMKLKKNWTVQRCLRELGCSPNQGTRWSRRDPPQYIALACAALAHQIEPWKATTAAE